MAIKTKSTSSVSEMMGSVAFTSANSTAKIVALLDSNGGNHLLNAKYWDGYSVENLIDTINCAVETFVIDSVSAGFGSGVSTTNPLITITRLTLSDGSGYSLGDLKIGDVILNKATGEFDYWVSSAGTNSATLNVLETQAIHLSISDPGHSHSVSASGLINVVLRADASTEVLTGVNAAGTLGGQTTFVSTVTGQTSSIKEITGVTLNTSFVTSVNATKVQSGAIATVTASLSAFVTGISDNSTGDFLTGVSSHPTASVLKSITFGSGTAVTGFSTSTSASFYNSHTSQSDTFIKTVTLETADTVTALTTSSWTDVLHGTIDTSASFTGSSSTIGHTLTATASTFATLTNANSAKAVYNFAEVTASGIFKLDYAVIANNSYTPTGTISTSASAGTYTINGVNKITTGSRATGAVTSTTGSALTTLTFESGNALTGMTFATANFYNDVATAPTANALTSVTFYTGSAITALGTFTTANAVYSVTTTTTDVVTAVAAERKSAITALTSTTRTFLSGVTYDTASVTFTDTTFTSTNIYGVKSSDETITVTVSGSTDSKMTGVSLV